MKNTSKIILSVFCTVVIIAVGIAAAVVFRFKSEEFSSARDKSESGNRSERKDTVNSGLRNLSFAEEEIRPVKLEFRLVHPDNDSIVPKYEDYLAKGGDPALCPFIPTESEILTEEPVVDELMRTEYTVVEEMVQMFGNEISDSSVSINDFGQPEILIFFNKKGKAEFRELTGKYVGRRLAIVIDGQLYSAPVLLRTRIDDGKAVITGSFSQEEAENVSAILKSGGLPFNISIASRSYNDAAACAEFLLHLRPDGFDESYFDTFRKNAIETLRRRLKARNYRNAEVSPVGKQFVSVRVPLVSPDDRAIIETLILRSGRLEFRLVHPDNDSIVPKYKDYLAKGGDPFLCPFIPTESEILTERGRAPLVSGSLETKYTLVETESRMNGDDINDSYVFMSDSVQRKIVVFFNEKGTAKFAELTGANAGRRLVAVIDGKLYSVFQNGDGSAVIPGFFSREEAGRISAALRRGRRTEGED